MDDLFDIFTKNKISTPGKHYVANYCPGCGCEFVYGDKRKYIKYDIGGSGGSPKKRMIRVCEDCKKEFKYEAE